MTLLKQLKVNQELDVSLKNKLKNLLSILLALTYLSCTAQDDFVKPNLRDLVEVETPIFKVWYSETKEQPVKLIYKSSNRPKNVDRGSMNFYTEDDYHTSNNKDYYRNVWDKGHLAPAATFSDSKENLKQTFSYLNCALQNQYLNRGQWRLLEEAERDWDDEQELEVTIDLEFSDSILPTGANIPSKFVKHIKFTQSGEWKCYNFPNERPKNDWEEYQVNHTH
ncbi:DNA/RNA non-specific endonuclease [bacterium]|nr:DNA/RNA non-specific endonuclease [bacterium]